MSTPCLINITNIERDDCLGESRIDINNNFTNIRKAICDVDKTQTEIEERLKFLVMHNGILNFWGDVTLGGLNFDSTGLGKINTVTGQNLTPYALCNGNNGTPNLQDRFVVASGGSYQQGELGPVFNSAASLQFNSVQLTIPQMPRHDHGVTDPGHGHTIGGGTHTHDYDDLHTPENWAVGTGVSSLIPLYILSLFGAGNIDLASNPSRTASRRTLDAKANVTMSNAKTNITIDNNGGDVPHENRPPFFALAYIMRIIP